jgi:hypothetical protein
MQGGYLSDELGIPSTNRMTMIYDFLAEVDTARRERELVERLERRRLAKVRATNSTSSVSDCHSFQGPWISYQFLRTIRPKLVRWIRQVLIPRT